MAKYQIQEGRIDTPVKTVVYGPEGIGKTTFASRFPAPIFIDTEGGSARLPVRRLPQPTSWAMLLDEVREARSIDCGTLVLDTADWAERLCIAAVCARAQVKGIEDFSYGKGYTYVYEEFGRLLDALDEVAAAGKQIVVTAHAKIAKFEQPDEMGAYDRWQMKTSKQVAPLLREWCDMLLFANYKTIVVRDGEGKNAKPKAQGGRRVMYTSHHPCWDAKNRFGLPEELPFEFSAIESVIVAAPAAPAPAKKNAEEETEGRPPRVAEDDAAKTPQRAPAPEGPVSGTEKRAAKMEQQGIPTALRELMTANNVEPEELQRVVAQRGYFPEDMLIRDYPAEFVEGCLVGAWGQVYDLILNNRDIPF